MTLKQERLAEKIRILLSELLMREVSDPRLRHITVTEVGIDAELMYATIYVNALGDESRQEEVMTGLARAKGYLRREVSKRLRVRNAPELIFRWDATLEHGEKINRLLSQLDIPPEEAADDDE